MTEDEAKTKWCPLVQSRPNIMFTDGPDGEAIGKKLEAANFESRKYKCIGSDCMMWRREKILYPLYPDDIATESVGYCGLAVKE